MSYQTFKLRWIGKRVDYDGFYSYQCVDLIKQYLHECYGLRPGAWGNAIDYWTNTNPAILTKFDRIATTEGREGDIVIFYGTSGNPYGHIGIAEKSDSTNVYTLEQNGSTGNGSGTGGDAIRMRWIARSRVAGILRPKKQGEPPMTPQEEANAYRIVLNRAMEHSGSGRTGYQFIVAAEAELKNQRAAAQAVLNALTKERDDARKALADTAAKLAKTNEELAKLQLLYNAKQQELNETIDAMNAQKAQYETQIAELGKVIEIKDNEIKRLTEELKNCTSNLSWSEHLALGLKGLWQAILEALKIKKGV